MIKSILIKRLFLKNGGQKEHFTGHADALKAAVGCRNPFQLKEVCECHLPFRKVAEESIQKVLKEILDYVEECRESGESDLRSIIHIIEKKIKPL